MQPIQKCDSEKYCLCAFERQIVDTMGIHNPSKGSRFIMGNLTM